MSPAAAQFSYLIACCLFVVGLKWLSSPATAVKGNRLSAVGMLVAVVVTLVDRQILSYGVIAGGLAVGSALGLWMARAVQMTQMPQMVALLNGLGGAASLLVGGAEYLRAYGAGSVTPIDVGITTQLTLLIGAVTLSGSLIAYAKLQELMTGRAIVFPGQKLLNGLIFGTIIALAIWLLVRPTAAPLWAFHAVWALSLALGVLLVIPIGGADMPVVISLLNSYSGIAGAMTGFVIKNEVLVIAGALVGSSGIILSQIMCKAMNRSLANVLFGAFGATTSSTKTAEGLTARQTTAEDAAVQLAYAKTVVVVPGYGLAVAQAQHVVRELADLVEKRGGEVKYAIHPVAGRMPGHMNVLLAEANVPYDMLFDMDQINADFDRTDVCLVIGANDVVNPAARTDPGSPIYGMPILNADRAASIIVLKRGMGAGFAGIENELFFNPKTAMLFGDAKGTLQKLVAELKAV